MDTSQSYIVIFIKYSACYFDVLPGTAACNLALSFVYIKRVLLYQDPMGKMVIAYFMAIIW